MLYLLFLKEFLQHYYNLVIMCLLFQGRERSSKHKHKDKHRDRDSEKSQPSSSSSKSMQQLRAERLRREKEERLKTQNLLAKMRGEKVPEEKEVETDERKMRYNSQFNPDLVRVRKPKRKNYYY